MLSHLNRHNLASSSCGVPLIAELHACINKPPPPYLDKSLIWLALLNGLDGAVPLLAKRLAAHALSVDEAVALFAAMHLVGNPDKADPRLHKILAISLLDAPGEGIRAAGASRHWEVISRLMELVEQSPVSELIRQASLLHLSTPADLFAGWLQQLEQAITQQMPFTALLQLSIFWRQPLRLPDGWQSQFAAAINSIGDLADAIPLYRLWMVVYQLAPDWDFACIRAAEMALRFEDFPIANHLLEQLSHSNISNVWFYDVKARCRYAYGDIKAATRLWSQALSELSPSSPEHQIFYDRMTLALRGKYGLAEASRLVRSGQAEAAQQYLRFLILHDPTCPHHHRLLAVLQQSFAVGEGAAQRQSQLQPNVEQVIESFRPLWQGKEDPTDLGDSPEAAWAFAQQSDEFLANCEQALSPEGL
jgi:tetratricopeptide (TPR) repeat protein